jgi:hypothetical protein
VLHLAVFQDGHSFLHKSPISGSKYYANRCRLRNMRLRVQLLVFLQTPAAGIPISYERLQPSEPTHIKPVEQHYNCRISRRLDISCDSWPSPCALFSFQSSRSVYKQPISGFSHCYLRLFQPLTNTKTCFEYCRPGLNLLKRRLN